MTRDSRDSLDSKPTPAATRRLGAVVSCLAVMIVSTYVFLPLQSLQPWKGGDEYVPFWNLIGRYFLGEDAELAARQDKLAQLKKEHLHTPPKTRRAEPKQPPPAATIPPYEPEPDQRQPVEVPLENVRALDQYYRKLTLVDLGVPGTLARASHWGDSLLGDDGLTFAIRARLQASFGDGGHGFHVLAPLNKFYLHRGVRFWVGTQWSTRCEFLFDCEADNRFGLGGVSVRSSGGGHSRFTTAKEAPGDRVSRFELWHERGPSGGVFEVRVDGAVVGTVETAAAERSDDVAVFELEDAPHRIDVHAIKGSVRGYGVVLERSGPGVVWENLAVIGTFTRHLSRQDPEHIANQVRLRKSDLLVFSLGGNDAQHHVDSIRQNYAKELASGLRRYRAGRPAASCLIIGVTAHGIRTPNGLAVRRSVPELVAIQRRVASERGCAFLDLYRAMGGADSIQEWSASRPALLGGDLGHPTSEGHAVLASLVHRALMHGYVEYRARVAGQRLPELSGGGAAIVDGGGAADSAQSRTEMGDE